MCGKHQRRLAKAVKRSRLIGLMSSHMKPHAMRVREESYDLKFDNLEMSYEDASHIDLDAARTSGSLSSDLHTYISVDSNDPDVDDDDSSSFLSAADLKEYLLEDEEPAGEFDLSFLDNLPIPPPLPEGSPGDIPPPAGGAGNKA